MDPKLDRAIDRCAADMARGVRNGTRPEFDSLWTALGLMGAVHRLPDGSEGTEKLKFQWLQQEVLRRLVSGLEQRLQDRLGPDPAISNELKVMFNDVLEGVEIDGGCA